MIESIITRATLALDWIPPVQVRKNIADQTGLLTAAAMLLQKYRTEDPKTYGQTYEMESEY